MDLVRSPPVTGVSVAETLKQKFATDPLDAERMPGILP